MSFLGGGESYAAPEMSQEEKDLMTEILSQLDDQKDWNEAMQPIQMKEQGYKWVENERTEEQKKIISEYDGKKSQYENIQSEINTILLSAKGDPYALAKSADRLKELGAQATPLATWLNTNEKEYKELTSLSGRGTYVEMSEDEYYASLNDREKAQYNLNKKQMERSTQAIEGTLPLSETLLSQKDKEFNELKQVYGIEGDTVENAQGTDTVSTQNLSDFKKRWAQVEEAQRFGQSSSSTEAAIMSSGLTTGQTNNNIGTMAAIGSGVGGAAGGYGSLLQPYQFYNQAGYQAQAANQANQTAQQGSMMGLLGMLAAAGMMASSKKFKKDIKAKTPKEEDEALKKIKKTKSYSYKYKPLMKMGDREHLGTLTEESPKEYVTLNGNAVDLGDKIEYLALGMKSLARKVDKIAAA
jgi:hypothetical protein